LLRKISIINLLVFIWLSNVFSQDVVFDGHRHKVGFDFGFGSQNGYFDYTYRVYLFQGQHYYSLITGTKWAIEVISQPQFNLTSFTQSDDDASESRGYEFGINAGILARRNFKLDLISVYAALSIGPHYVSGTPERQSPGFIFSDNAFIGMNVRLYSDLYVDVRYGFRHISNADIKQPNLGVDAFIINVGFFHILSNCR
jgi:hypothetical protein